MDPNVGIRIAQHLQNDFLSNRVSPTEQLSPFTSHGNPSKSHSKSMTDNQLQNLVQHGKFDLAINRNDNQFVKTCNCKVLDEGTTNGPGNPSSMNIAKPSIIMANQVFINKINANIGHDRRILRPRIDNRKVQHKR